MKRIPLNWVLLTLLVFALFLVVTLPARHLLGWLSGGHLAVQGVEGTSWRGRVLRLALDQQVVGPLVWQLEPVMLLTGRVEYRLYLQSGAGGGEFRAGRSLFGTTYVRDAQFSTPAADMARQLQLNLVALGGQVLADVRTLTFESGWIGDLDAQVIWQDAQVLQPTKLSLGNLQMQLSRRDTQVVGALSDQGGPLELGGEVLIGQDRKYRIDASLKTREGAAPELVQTVQLLGRPDPQGRYHLQLNGALQ